MDIKEHAAAVLTVLARLGIPADVLELLTHGNPDRNIPPGALEAALSRAFDASKSEGIQAAMAAERAACAMLARYHSHHALWQGLPADSLDAFGIALAKRIESGIRERRMPKLPDIDAEKGAVIADLQARVDGERAFLDWAVDTLHEINVSNYDHDEVCRLNERSVEVILATRARIAELEVRP